MYNYQRRARKQNYYGVTFLETNGYLELFANSPYDAMKKAANKIWGRGCKKKFFNQRQLMVNALVPNVRVDLLGGNRESVTFLGMMLGR